MRPLILAAVLFLTVPAFAGVKPEEAIANPALLAQLQDEAGRANPREQCFLYAQVVHVMTEIAGHQIAEGEPEKAAVLLKEVQHYAELIHLGLARDTKRLREAEMLMHTTTHHLGQYLRAISSDDKQELQATLAQLDKINEELLTQVFQH